MLGQRLLGPCDPAVLAPPFGQSIVKILNLVLQIRLTTFVMNIQGMVMAKYFLDLSPLFVLQGFFG
jgi:hypothetical protein